MHCPHATAAGQSLEKHSNERTKQCHGDTTMPAACNYKRFALTLSISHAFLLLSSVLLLWKYGVYVLNHYALVLRVRSHN